MKQIKLQQNLCLCLCICILSINCKNNTSESASAECTQDKMPKYDYRATVEGQMTPQLDSLLRIEKRRDIFKPCRALIYDVEFTTETGELISKEEVSVTASGNRWVHHPTLQDEIVIEYKYSDASVAHINKYQLNKTAISTNWIKSEITGIIENVEKIWMHPFRSNQYFFTQVAPFPQIELPPTIGKVWTDYNISLSENFGDWSNMKVSTSFEVLALETTDTQYKTITNCWKIRGISEFPLGKSELVYWFNDTLGFVKLEYKNYGNQMLNIELKNVIDNIR